jgi:apolipoprotein D and lipocalin family protein
MRIFIIISALILNGCTGIPGGVHPVEDFSADKYLGKWYEIARLDHSFERGLDQVTAEYTKRDDGGIKVINRGYSIKSGKWKEAEGKAYFVGDSETGHLKVSFFGPFYGSYIVFELDKTNYQYAFVAGYNKSYLWLLSRTPDVDQNLIDKFINKSRELGFTTDDLILVNQKK